MNNLCQLFRETVVRYGDSIALHHRDKDWSYATLWQRATCVATWLRENGLAPGDRVAILLSNSADYAINYFGVLLARGIVVALNPESTPRELSDVVANCEPAAVIISRQAKGIVTILQRRPPTVRIALVADGDQLLDEIRVAHGASLDELWSAPPQNEIVNLAEVSVDTIAQIIYTSGTSGKPKGVTLSHRNLSANTESIVHYLRLTHLDSVFVVLPFFYSYGNSLLLTHFAVGGRLIVASDFTFWNRALDLMASQQATGFSGVPSSFAMLVHKSDFCRRQFPSLRYITCAGGALTSVVASKLRRAMPQVQFFSMYGQTEASARLSYLSPDELEARPGSIGRGIPGVLLNVLDEQGRRVAPGEVGEIVARGENVMLGYWNDPIGTRRVVKDDWLHTGDLARVDEDGYLYIVGRSSEMIKYGAYRISPKEIEDAIAEVPGVVEVAVVGEADHIFGERPIAYIVLNNNAATTISEDIVNYCAQIFPRHKVIHRAIIVDKIPKTASGKVAKGILRSAPSSAGGP